MVHTGAKLGLFVALLAVSCLVIFGLPVREYTFIPLFGTPAPTPVTSSPLPSHVDRSNEELPTVGSVTSSTTSTSTTGDGVVQFSTPTSINTSRRAIMPLLLTHFKYHGTELLATTIKGWVLKFLVPQGNIDLVIFYDTAVISAADIIKLLRLTPAPSWRAEAGEQNTRTGTPQRDVGILGNGRFLTPHHASYVLILAPVLLTLPSYIIADPSVLNRSDWMKCGCPPYCPPRKASVEYIQGTRWYSHELFLEPITARYMFWLKLDVDIWIFREFPFNMVDTLHNSGLVAAHTGKAYNGEGCSNELDKAIRTHQKCPLDRKDPCSTIVSSREEWWQQDDNVFYTNFVMYRVDFFMRPDVMALSSFLNNYERGFFKYRWTDQSLAHKVLGVYHGPTEAAVALDWSELRWQKKRRRPNSCFWHSKKAYTRRQLAQFM